MEQALITLIAALALVALTNLIGLWIPIPVPIFQTVVGILLAFVPGIPAVQLNPDFVLLGVLPPLVYAAAVNLPWEDFLENISAIGTLAFGLVAATTAIVAVVAHAIVPGLPWPAAIVLGAIVSPTDPVASTALASRIGVPQRLVTILEGEGLVNDAVALTIKTVAIAALLGHSVGVSAGVLKFLLIVVGEIIYGLAVGWIFAEIRKRIADSNTETVVTMITPFAAYLLPAWLGGSGVLATVATGMYIGEQGPELVPSGTRLHLTSVWGVMVYGLNGTLFILTGLQARSIWEGRAGDPGNILLFAVVIAATAVAVRFGWTWPAAWILRAISARLRRRSPMPPSRHLMFIAWSGMRGAISLAAALSIPVSVTSRPRIVFVTAAVIAATLILEGTPLPWLIRTLKLDQDAEQEREETRKREAEARKAVAMSAVSALDGVQSPVADRLRQDYGRIAHGDGGNSEHVIEAEVQLRRKAIDAQRRHVIKMHRQRQIDHVVLRRIERDLDLQEAALENRLGYAD